MPDGSFYRFRSSPSGDQLSGLLDEGRRLLEADGHQLPRDVLSDPLDDDFGRTVESSLDLHTVGDRGLSRGGSFVRRLTVQDVGELGSRVLEKLCVSSLDKEAMLDRRLFGMEVTILTSRESHPSQRWEKMYVLRTCGLAGLVQMKPAHVSNPGANVVLESTQENFP